MTKRATRGLYHGYLVVEKPAGITSHDVVAAVRRMTGERRVGHAGTLDPAAVGVLPVAVGLATRTVEYLSDADKSYLADITFGVSTDSLDAEGTVTNIAATDAMTREQLEDIFTHFRGDIDQIPPMHSAIKIDGKPLYERARKGEELELPPRSITIHELRIVSWNNPVLRVYVRCSKGTYIRALARDLGEAARVGAYMSNLVRLSTGPFTLQDAWRLETLTQMVADGHWEHVAVHPDAALLDRPAIILNEKESILWRNGSGVQIQAPDGLIRVYDANGNWLGVGMAAESAGMIKPEKVVTEVEV